MTELSIASDRNVHAKYEPLPENHSSGHTLLEEEKIIILKRPKVYHGTLLPWSLCVVLLLTWIMTIAIHKRHFTYGKLGTFETGFNPEISKFYILRLLLIGTEKS